METVKFYDVAEHIVDSHNGIYSAQVFAQMFPFETLKGISREDYDILLFGPEHEDYVEVWAEKLDNVTIVDKDGNNWSIYENEGIYVYPENVNIDWEEISNY